MYAIRSYYVFSTAIPRDGEDALAAESIKTRIRKMINEEDKLKPLSDNAISQMLEEENIQIARRTVAKYREQMKIVITSYSIHYTKLYDCLNLMVLVMRFI